MKEFETVLLQGERMDQIGFNNLRLIQKPEDFCYGVDAVILADFAASVKDAKRVCDLGTGTGIIPLIVSHKTEAQEIWGMELQQDSYRRAVRNSELNGLSQRVRFVQGDVSQLSRILELREKQGYFDVVTSNPPYMIGSGGLTNKNTAKALARHETTGTLTNFIQTAAALLRDKGHFFMVHRPSRLVDICVECRTYKLEPKEMRFVSPNKQTAPNILLLHCVKNGGVELKMLDPLYVYEEEGGYTAEINSIYEREGGCR